MKYKQVLWIDPAVREHQVFVDSVNEDTLALVYPAPLVFEVERIGFVFEKNGPMAAYLQANADLLIGSGVKHMDFLACDTLPEWKPFYDRLTGITVGASNNQTGNLQYGGDWLMESTCEDVESIYFTRSIQYYQYLLGISNYSLFLDASGDLWGCGYNANGQLGLGNTNSQVTKFSFMRSGVKSFAAGGSHTLALDASDNLWGCGYNANGQLGLGNINTSVPNFSFMRSGVKSFAAGGSHTLALDASDNLWGCGYNIQGQLGLGNTNSPVTNFSFMRSGVKSFAGSNHTLVLDASGNLWGCGYNIFGQLGLGNTNTSVANFSFMRSNVSSFALGLNHTLVLDASGDLWGCGWNANGQLGLGNTNSPVTNFSFMRSGVKYFAAGLNHTLVLDASGDLWGCGSNSNGQLGLGNTNSQVTNFSFMRSKVFSFETGGSHTLMLDFYGNLWGCGYNIQGQLGLNNNGDNVTNFSFMRSGVSWIGPNRFIRTAISVDSMDKTSARMNSSVNLFGYNFSNASYLTIGNTSVDLSIVSNTQIQFKVPPVVQTNATVILYTNVGPIPAGTLTILPLFSLTRYNPSSVIPRRQLQITGTNFADIAYVQFENPFGSTFGIQSVYPTSVSSTQINVSVPVGLTDQVTVTVFDLYQNNSSMTTNLTILNLSIGSILPALSARNTSITITGNNLENTSYVLFGNVSTRVTFKNATQVNVSIPILIPPLNSITLYDIYGNNTSSLFTLRSFTLTQYPSKVSPGAPFQITGSNFYNISYVRFGTTNVTPFLVNTTQINVSVPRVLADNVSVSVVDLYNTSTSVDLSILNLSFVSITPKAVRGAPITLLGSNLLNVSYVKFGTVNQQPFSKNDTTLNVSLPFGVIGNVSVGIYDAYGNNVSTYNASTSFQGINLSYAIQVKETVTLIGSGLMELDIGLPSTFVSDTAPMYTGYLNGSANVSLGTITNVSFPMYPVTVTQANLGAVNSDVVTVRGMPTGKIPDGYRLFPVDKTSCRIPPNAIMGGVHIETSGIISSIQIDTSGNLTLIPGPLYNTLYQIFIRIDNRFGKNLVYGEYTWLSNGARNPTLINIFNLPTWKNILYGRNTYSLNLVLSTDNIPYPYQFITFDYTYPLPPPVTHATCYFGYFKPPSSTVQFNLSSNDLANLRIGTSLNSVRSNGPVLLDLSNLSVSSLLTLDPGTFYPIVLTYVNTSGVAFIEPNVSVGGTTTSLLDYCTADKNVSGLYSYNLSETKFFQTINVPWPSGTNFTNYNASVLERISRIYSPDWAYGTLAEQTYWTNASNLTLEGLVPITRLNISDVQVTTNILIQGTGFHANCSVYLDGSVKPHVFNGNLNLSLSPYSVLYVRDGIAYSNFFSRISVNPITQTTAIRNSSVNVFGYNFSTSTISSVTIGTANASYAILSNTSLQVRIPASTQTNVAFTVNNGFVRLPVTNSFTIPPPFSITRYIPSVLLPNTPLQIEGVNFSNLSYVRFTNNVIPTSFNETTITVTAPSTAGNFPVTVFDVYGNSSSISANLTVVSLQVQSIPSAVPGAPVQITGQNFYNLSYVNFGGIPLTNITYTPTKINLSVPKVTGNVSVGVYDLYGNNASISFVVAPLFSVSRYSPSSVIPNTSLQVIGSNFSNISYVLFGTTKVLATGTNTSVNVRVPAGLANNVSVTVFDLYGNSSSILATLSILNLSIRSAIPDKAPPGFAITLVGENLSNASFVLFGNVSVPYYTRSNSSVVVTVPDVANLNSLTLYDIYGNNLSTSFTSVGLLKITSIQPSALPRSILTLSGSDFYNLKTVFVGNVSTPFSNTSVSITLTVPPQSILNCSIVVTDVFNLSSSVGFTYLPTLQITSTNLMAVQRSRLTLSGNNFSNLSSVMFGHFSTSFTYTDSTVVAVVPVSSENASITVYDIYNNNSSVSFTYIPPLQITQSASAKQRATITLPGTNLYNLSEVYFGNVSAVFSNTSVNLSILVPDQSIPNCSLVVYDLYGNNSSVSFTYHKTVITSVIPPSGPARRTIRLTGDYLSDLSYAVFNTSLSILSTGNGSIHLSVPVGSGTQTITLYDIYDNIATAEYTYENMSLTRVNPSQGPPNRIVNLEGVYFNNLSAVYFGVRAPILSAGNGSINVSAPLNGSSIVTIYDVYGNTTSAMYEYQRPSLTSVSSAPQNASIELVGAYLDNTSFVRFGNQKIIPSRINGSWYVRVPVGSDTTLTVTDIYENETSLAYTYRNPSIQALNPSAATRKWALTVQGEHLETTTRVNIGGQSVPFTLNPPTVILPPGEGNVSVELIDLYGNVNQSMFQYKNPRITSINLSSGRTNKKLNLFGEYLENTSYVLIGETPHTGMLETNASGIAVFLPEKYGNVSVIAIDICGNETPFGGNLFCTGGDVSLYGVTPLMGPHNTQVTISGDNLSYTSQVLFGGLPASILTVTKTSVNVSVKNTDPDAGVVNVTILDVYEDGETWMGTYTFKNPKITGGSVSTGTRGTPLHLFGQHLEETKTVKFGETNASFYPSNGLHLTAPEHVDGPILVTLTDILNNQVTYPFTYQNPIVTSTLLSGPQRSPAQIFGNYLSNTSVVTFDGVYALFDASDTTIRLTVPDGSGNASVVIRDTYGNRLYTQFFYENPNASFLSVNHGPKNMPVTLFGIHLQNTSYVRIGASTVYPVVGPNQLTFAIPDTLGNTVTVYDIYNNTTQLSFTYENPSLYGIFADGQPDDFGTTNKEIHLFGEYLNNTSYVFFENLSARFSFETSYPSNFLNVVVPPSSGIVPIRMIDRYQNEVVYSAFTYENTSVHSISPLTGTVGWPITVYGDYLLNNNIYFNGEEWETTYTQSIIETTVPVGTGNVSIKLIDLYNNVIYFPQPFEYRNPRLTRLSASTGRAGRTLTLYGENLSNTSWVSIGSKVYPFLALDTTVQVPVPDQNGYVTVITYDIYNASCEGGPFYAMGKEPTLISLHPSRGPNHSPVTLYGTNLSYTARVYLNENGLNPSPLNSSINLSLSLSFQKNVSTIVTTIPPGTGEVMLYVYDEAEEVLTWPFTYINPELEEVFPSEGPNHLPVMLRGKYLNRTSTVYFQNTSIPFRIESGDVKITIPNSSGNASIELIDDLGNRTSGTFLYKNPELYTSPGEPQRKAIQLFGKNLSNTSSVTFNGVPVAFQAYRDYLEVTVPDGNVSTTIVATDTLQNVATSILYYQNPSAEFLTPQRGTFRVPVLLKGAYLQNTSYVKFGAIDVSFENVSGDLYFLVPDSSGNVSVVVTDRYTNTTSIPFVYENPELYTLPGEPQRKLIQLFGKNLSNTSSVTFNGAPVTFQAYRDYVEVTVPDGEVSTTVVLTDTWGNPVSTVLLYQNPSIRSLLPNEGPYRMPLIIRGDYLQNTSHVRFGAIDVSFVNVSGDLHLLVPDSSGNVSVVVTDRYTNTTSYPFFYKPPTVTSLNPSKGPQRRTVEILGINLSNTYSVSFGAFNVSFDRFEGGLRVKAPDQEGEVVVNTVDLYGNNASSTFLYRNPKISRINPSAGRTNRYTKVYGEHLGESLSVFFGEKEGTLETATVTDTSLNVVIPAYYGNVSVSVKDPYGNVTYWDRSFLCLGGNAEIYGIFPDYGTTRTRIHLSGENLSSSAKVTIGTNASFTIESSQDIRARAPPGVGPAHVIVTDILEEDVVYLGTFQYQNPKITSVTPSTGTTHTRVTLSGDYLENTSFLFFEGLPLELEDLSFRVPVGSGTATIELADYLDNRIFNRFTYQNPNLSSLDPLQAPQRSVLRIHGQYLWNTSEVTIGKNASILDYTTDWVDVEIPEGDGPAMVEVRDRLNNTLSLGGFTYKNPYFGSIYPTEGPLNKSIHLYGLNLHNTSQVIFGGIQVSYVIYSDVHIQVYAPDTSGNATIDLIDRYKNKVSYASYLYQNPSITSILPAAGPQRSKVTLVGDNLSNTREVRFNETNASFEKTDNGLYITVPDASNASVTLFVTDTIGNVVFTPFQYLNPTLTSVELSAPQRTLLTMVGTNLSNTYSVTFGGQNASFYPVEDGLRITVPDSTQSEVILEVTDPWGNQLFSPFEYLNPRVDSIDPSFGAAFTRVHVIGAHLTNCSAYVGGKEVVFHENLLRVPPGEGTVEVLLVDPLDNRATAVFTYHNVSIRSIHPIAGPKHAPMVLRGDYLQNTSFVYFDQTPVPYEVMDQTMDLLNETSIRCTLPDLDGNVTVRLIDSLGNETITSFQYENPELFSFSPNRGIQNSSTRIVGKYLANTSFVYVNGNVSIPFVRFDDELEIRVPVGDGTFFVTVEDRYQNKVDLYEYTYANPYVSGIYPVAGPKKSTLRLSGVNLSGIETVRMGINVSFVLLTDLEIKVPELEGEVYVESIDLYGNVMPFYKFTYENPTLTALIPDAGPQGSFLNISGHYLSNTSQVRVGGIPTEFTYDGTLTLTLPTYEGNASVEVIDDYGNLEHLDFMYQNPSFSSLVPPAGPRQKVILRGNHLSQTSLVKVGDTYSGFVPSTTEIEIFLPEKDDQNVSIYVQDPYGNEIECNYTYQNPDITYITPWHGTTHQTLRIVGNYLSNTSYVFFVRDQSYPVSILEVSLHEVRVEVPAGEGEMTIVIVDRYDNVTPFDGTFLYENPSITSVTPNAGPRNASIQILGTFLANTSTVYFGEVPANFSAQPDRLDVLVPDSYGPVILSVTDYFNNTLYQPFTYENPSIQQVFPYFGRKKSLVYVYGLYLARTSRVTFGEVDASYIVVSAEVLKVVVPDSSGTQIMVSDPYQNNVSYPFTYENTTITRLNPAEGPANSSLRIEGFFLEDTVEVRFDNVSANFSAYLDRIDVIVPIQSNLPSNLRAVVTVIDTLGNSLYDYFTYQNPEILSQSPYSGPKNSTLHLYGNHLSNVMVKFGDVSATILSQSKTQVDVLVSDLFGEYTVEVKDPYDNRAYASYFFENPYLNLLDPESGPAGKQLNLYGEYLGNTSTIKFNGIDASFEKVSDQWIIPTVPPGTGTAIVEWQDLFGNSLFYPNLFTYENPSISGLSVTQGAQRILLTLYGDHLFEIVRIQFGEADADILLIESGTSIRIRVPDQVGDPIVPVILTDRYGNVASYENYLYLNQTVTSITPDHGPSRSFATIDGFNLSNTDTVTFDQIPTTVTISDERLIVKVPEGRPGHYLSVVEITDLYTNTLRIFYEYNNLLIQQVLPDHAPSHSDIRIEGLSLENTSFVYFGDLPATFEFTDALIVRVPDASGVVPLILEDSLGNRIQYNSFLYENPKIDTLFPLSGPQKSTVTVVGANLSNTSYAYLGNLSADFSLDAGVKVTLPDSSGNVSLILVDRYGNIAQFPFEYANPKITHIDPLYGKTGRYLTLYGEHLEYTEKVHLGIDLGVEEKNTSSVKVILPEVYGNVSVTTVDIYGNQSIYESFEGLGGAVYTFEPSYGTTSTQIRVGGDLTQFNTFRVNGIPSMDLRVPQGTGIATLELYDSIRDDLLFLGRFEYRNPKVTSITPVRGTTNTRVNLSGLYLGDSSFVYFGEKVASDVLQVRAPKQEGNVSVFVVDYLHNRIEAGNFFYENPDIQAISPHEGPPHTSLRIQGKYLNNTSFARIGTSCEIVSISEKEVFLKVPPGTATVPIELEDYLGNIILFDVENDGGFTYQNPLIQQLVPASGPMNMPIRLEGEHLARTKRVSVGGENVSFVYDGTLLIHAPRQSGMVDVYAEDDLNNVTPNVSFTFTNPSIRDIYPPEGSIRIPVILDGYYLSNTSSVKFGQASTPFDYRDGWIYTTAPTGSGNVSVFVTDRYENTVSIPFTYKNPHITRVAIQGPKMIVQGEYLFNTSTVYIDEQQVNFQLSPTGLIADLLDASGSIAIECIDRYGYPTMYEGEFYYFIPEITNIFPHSGLSGSSLTLFGDNLSNTTYVTIDGVNASIESLMPNRIDVRVPDGSGIVVVEVFEKNENSTKYAGRYTYETITLYKVTPMEAYSNQIVFVEGSDLSTIVSVEFGEYIVTDVTHLSKTLISVKVPPIQEPCVLTVKDQRANKGSYLHPFTRIIPTVTTISESRLAGDLLLLTGSNLDQVNVMFDRTQATLHAISASSLLCTIPYGKGTVPITLKDRYQNTYVV